MGSRRDFIGKGVTALAGISVLPAIDKFQPGIDNYKQEGAGKSILRFGVVSDIHYGQDGTDYALHSGNMIKWLNEEHNQNHLDFAIINGDLVHNRPDLLPEFKNNYLDKLTMPYHTIPGNHDHADWDVWEKVFGYGDKYSFEKGETGFILANTTSVTGAYTCPDNSFIKKALDGFTDKKIVFVVLHVPVVQWLETEKSGFLDCPETVGLLEQYPNVKAVFHGHDHLLDDVRYAGKLPCFFDAHIGGDWGTVYRGYRVVEVAPDYSVYTYQVNASKSPVLNTAKF